MKVCYCDESGTGEEPIAVMVGNTSDSKKPLKWGFFIPQIGLSELCQKKTGFFEFFYFEETRKTLVKIGGRGGI